MVERFIPMAKAGPLRNGYERGKGSIFHAVPERVGGQWVPIYDAVPALCGQAPAIMWSSWRPQGQEVTCPRCLKKLERAKGRHRHEEHR